MRQKHAQNEPQRQCAHEPDKQHTRPHRRGPEQVIAAHDTDERTTASGACHAPIVEWRERQTRDGAGTTRPQETRRRRDRMVKHLSGLGQQVIIWSTGLVVTAVMLTLGIWQMDSFRDQGQAALIARINEPPMPLLQVAPTGRMPEDAYGRTVEAGGRYLPTQQLVIPHSTQTGRARVLTAFELSDGSIVPVVRGETMDASGPPVARGERVRGVLLPSEAEPEVELPSGHLGTIRLPRIAQLWEQSMIPGFLVLDTDHAHEQGLVAAEVTLPNNAGHARNQGYALQWWIFAAAAVAATIKLSRDAANGTGFMRAPRPVDHSGDNVDNLSERSTTGRLGGTTRGCGQADYGEDDREAGIAREQEC